MKSKNAPTLTPNEQWTLALTKSAAQTVADNPELRDWSSPEYTRLLRGLALAVAGQVQLVSDSAAQVTSGGQRRQLRNHACQCEDAIFGLVRWGRCKHYWAAWVTRLARNFMIGEGFDMPFGMRGFEEFGGHYEAIYDGRRGLAYQSKIDGEVFFRTWTDNKLFLSVTGRYLQCSQLVVWKTHSDPELGDRFHQGESALSAETRAQHVAVRARFAAVDKGKS